MCSAMLCNQILSACLVREYFGCFFNIFKGFVSQNMDKKASLSETKRAQIVILDKEGFSQRKIYKEVFGNKTAVHQTIATFQNFGFYHDKKRVESQKKQVLVMKT